MGKKELISRLNSYYEELSMLNREIEKLLRESDPKADKISELLNRKDFCIAQCIKIKDIVENNNSEIDLEETTPGPDTQQDRDEKEDIALLEKMLKEEEINQELVQKNLYKIKEELQKIKESKGKVKSYQSKEHKYGSINKKA